MAMPSSMYEAAYNVTQYALRPKTIRAMIEDNMGMSVFQVTENKTNYQLTRLTPLIERDSVEVVELGVNSPTFLHLDTPIDWQF